MTAILSVGRDQVLMRIRTMVLHQAGYAVKEAYSGEEAIRRLTCCRFSLMLICHTIAERERGELVAAARRTKPGLPIVRICSGALDSRDEGCCSVDNVAPSFLSDLSEVVQKAHGETFPDMEKPAR